MYILYTLCILLGVLYLFINRTSLPTVFTIRQYKNFYILHPMYVQYQLPLIHISSISRTNLHTLSPWKQPLPERMVELCPVVWQLEGCEWVSSSERRFQQSLWKRSGLRQWVEKHFPSPPGLMNPSKIIIPLAGAIFIFFSWWIDHYDIILLCAYVCCASPHLITIYVYTYELGMYVHLQY